MADLREGRPKPDIRVVRSHGRQSTDDPDAIRDRIQETRYRMSNTIEEIGSRLNPHHVTEQVKHNIREATIGRAETMARNAADRVNETRGSIMDTIRDNPIPAAMVGIGLGWLVYNGRKEETHPRTRSYAARGPYAGSNWAAGDRAMEMEYMPDSGDRMRDEAEGMAHRARERAGEMADRVQDTAGEMGDRARSAVSGAREAVGEAVDHAGSMVHDATDRAQEMADRAMEQGRETADELAMRTRQQAHRLEDRFQQTLRETPLVVGAAAMALGLAAGLAIPETDAESRLMGGARDDLVDRTRDRVGEMADRVGDMAERVEHVARSTAHEAMGDEGKSGSTTTGDRGTSSGGAQGQRR